MYINERFNQTCVWVLESISAGSSPLTAALNGEVETTVTHMDLQCLLEVNTLHHKHSFPKWSCVCDRDGGNNKGATCSYLSTCDVSVQEVSFITALTKKHTEEHQVVRYEKQKLSLGTLKSFLHFKSKKKGLDLALESLLSSPEIQELLQEGPASFVITLMAHVCVSAIMLKVWFMLE